MMYFLRSCSRSSSEQLLRFQMQQLADLHRNIIEHTVQIAADPLPVKIVVGAVLPFIVKSRKNRVCRFSETVSVVVGVAMKDYLQRRHLMPYVM